MWNCGQLHKFSCTPTNQPTNQSSMEQSFLRPNSQLAEQLSAIFLNLRVHCHVHKRPPVYPICSQINALYSSQSFFKIHCNIIFHFSLGLPSSCYLQGFSPEFCMFLISLMLSHNVWWDVQFMGLVFRQYSVTCSLSCPNILLSIMFFPKCKRPRFKTIQNNR